MKTEAAYVPPHPFTEAEVHTLLRQPSALSGSKKRRRDFQRGEPWFTSLAPCRRHALHKAIGTSKQTRHAQTTPITILQYLSLPFVLSHISGKNPGEKTERLPTVFQPAFYMFITNCTLFYIYIFVVTLYNKFNL